MLNVSIFNTIVTQLYNYFNSCFLFLRAERQICDDNIVPVYTAIYGSPQAGVFWQASSIWLSEHHLGFKFGSLWSHKEASYSIASRYPPPPEYEHMGNGFHLWTHSIYFSFPVYPRSIFFFSCLIPGFSPEESIIDSLRYSIPIARHAFLHSQFSWISRLM